MIRPKPEDLLARAAEALEATVLPFVNAGPARRQLLAATALMRRIAYALPRQFAVLAADTTDLETTLREVQRHLEDAGAPDVPGMAALRAALSQSAPTSPEELQARNLTLQEMAGRIEADAASFSIDAAARTEIDRTLQAFYRRTVERDLSLLPPGKVSADAG